MITLEQILAADAATVWKYLTHSRLVGLWMSETPDFSIQSEWKRGGAIRMEAFVNGSLHVSEGVITRFEPGKSLSYEYLNSVSLEHYRTRKHDMVDFRLEPTPAGTILQLRCTTGYGDVEEKHLRLYWTATLAILKKFVESDRSL